MSGKDEAYRKLEEEGHDLPSEGVEEPVVEEPEAKEPVEESEAKEPEEEPEKEKKE